jgi:catechol 2,3-dioxygenase-like lactoylglutathione lyase family enzyme
MLDHIVVHVKDYAVAKAFYEKALAPLGAKVLMEFGEFCGVGRDKPDLWLGSKPSGYWKPDNKIGSAPIHIAITARSRAEVDAFYEAAIAAGATDYGKPGIRAEYHPNYYGAFVIDPDGNDLEAVFHGA